jgi:hypothetical protein
MPKRVFWPIALVALGLIFLASNMRLLPVQFLNLWPLILIVVGLGGLLISDRDEWMSLPKKATKSAPAKAPTKSSKKVAAPKKKSKR